MSNALAVIETFVDAWRLQDIELTLATLHEAVIYRLHLEPGSHPHAGSTVGKLAMAAVMGETARDWDHLYYQPTLLGVDEDIARVQVRYQIIHRASRSLLAGSNRMIVKVKDDRVVEIDQFEDAARIAAFMRYVAGCVD